MLTNRLHCFLVIPSIAELCDSNFWLLSQDHSDQTILLFFIQGICERLESEKSRYKELKTKSLKLFEDPEYQNQIANQVESIDMLFNRVLVKTVAKQDCLEKAAIQLQDLDTGIDNLYQVVGEIEGMLSLQKVEMTDAELKDNLERFEVCNPRHILNQTI